MKNHGKTSTPAWFVWAVVLCGALWMPALTATGQEAAAPPAGTATDEADEAAPAGDEATEAPDDDAVPAVDAPPESADTAIPQTAEAESDATEAEPPGGSITGEDLEVDEVTAEGVADAGMGAVTIGLIVLAIFVVPILVGNFLAKAFKMQDYGWKISLILGATAASILIITFGEFKFGPDLAGGITLIYELEDAPAEAPAARDQAADDEDAAAGRRVNYEMEELIEALKERIDPTGTREVTIRPFGPAIEIIIPATGQDQLEYVKRRITALGQLEFRITADPRFPKDRPIIDQAKLAPPSQKNILLGGNKVAEWVTYSVEEFGPVEEEGGLVKRMAGKTPEALVLMDPFNVTGDYLSSTTMGADERGAPAVNFSFNRAGAGRFKILTSENRPSAANQNVYRNLGIILDKRLISAPIIRTTISSEGQISGGSMTEEEVEYIIRILKSGSLPMALNKTPVSEQIISPTLGAQTIEQGKMAIGASLAAVLLFMLVYYRFAGIVACVVLTLNLLLVLAIMVLIDAALTLPGLAGLVLTIGMAVDANILIYERIREELRGGAALRMAIRNGFGRAMSAIIDSNVTTIISGIALYVFATDQVKGFAVTLILGIITSMFTAIFCARLIFDVAERQGWIKQLNMMRLLGTPNVDFLRVRWITSALSLALIAIGMAAVIDRGKSLLDIDFSGGSSVTFTLEEGAAMPLSEVRSALLETPLGERNLVVVERGETNTRYSLDTSEQSVDEVKRIVEETFEGKLLSYQVEVSDVQPFSVGDFSGSEATLSINEGSAYAADEGISHDALLAEINSALEEAGLTTVEPTLSHPAYEPGSVARHKQWTVRLGGLDQAAAENMLSQVQNEMNSTAMFPLASKIGGRVSSSMQLSAVLAMLVSLLGVVLYLWVRFQRVTYGLASAIALVHDVLVTISLLAISAYIVDWVPGLASVLQIDSFQISLTIVAALLTIIGYSLNDTIVTFDRLREVKGKSPQLTAEMVNRSVNQTLSRTLLTATTVFLVVAVLYFFGGDGIHGFAYAFLVGTVAGTYSTIYIAAPALLWLSGVSADTSPQAPAAAMGRAG
jgi:SecD/SecF fusion protein